MRILLLTQWFQPEPHFKGLPFAKALKERGHDVEVLTGFPNYPGGSLYKGYRVRPFRRETIDGIRVHRVALYPSHDRSTVRRILNYLSFAASSLLMGLWLTKRPDVVYVYNLVTLGPTAFAFRLLRGAHVVIDVQDVWPESVTGSGMLGSRLMGLLLGRLSNRVYKKADRLVVLSPGFRRLFEQRGIGPERIDVVYNWCNEDGHAPGSSPSHDPWGLHGRFNILFAGTMGVMQGLDTVLKCAAICRTEVPEARFVLVGGGIERNRLEGKAEAMGLTNVKFLPPQPVEAMGPIYDAAQVLLVHLKRDPLFEITIPSKIQAYLFTGKPVLAAIRGDAAELVLRAGAGVACAPDNPMEMARAVKTLHAMSTDERKKMGDGGREFYMEHLSFQKGVDEFERIFSLTAGMEGSRPWA